MRIDWWTLALQTINVLVLVWILGRFLFRPVMNAITARQEAANKLLADAETAKAAAQAEDAALKQRNLGFAAEAEQRRAAMQAQVASERADLLAKARAEADAVRQQARADMVGERVQQTEQLEQQAAMLAGHMAEKLLQRLPVALHVDAMFEALLMHLQTLPEDEKVKLAQESNLVVATVAPLDEEAQKRFTAQLETALPGVRLQGFVTDAAMIGGFELRGPHVSLRNSWRADLDAMLKRLREDADGRLA